MLRKILIVLLISIIPLSSFAEDCSDIIEAAKQVEASGDKVISLKTREIEVQKDLINIQSKQIEELTKKKDSVFSNPWLYLTIGVIAGGLLMKGK